MAKKKKAKAKAKGKAKDMLVVTSKVKAYIKSKKMLTSGVLAAALNDCLHCCLDRAIQRAKDNKRSTVKPQDI